MKNRKFAYGAIIAGLLAAFGASGVALAEPEKESNYGLENAQPLNFSTDDIGGSARVDAVIGVITGSAIGDVDLYSFHANKDDEFTFDIDFGKNMGARSVDTHLYVFGPGLTTNNPYEILVDKDDSSLPFPYDQDSKHRYDPYYAGFKAHKSGTYYVGVTGYPRELLNGAVIKDRPGSTNENGDYVLIVTRTALGIQTINIEIKPGSGTLAPINPRARGSVPVALLSGTDFDPFTVVPSSLRFGSTGDEKSWQRCAKDGDDLNGDGKPDRVCHFDNQKAEFDPSEAMATLTGETTSGTRFQGTGLLKIVPVKRTDD